ncbi:IQ domain-containing protein D [Lingula anatina]|uniref:Dynein regulatory complex protein 10 n=1 Tax=Lingula anatina TaxID=7574 RepID=A0A1S3H6Y0_LINAN|nr:IQ domain-containing protein D [Lingula anatina]|eukprot:XP_013381737.1 IQ domain-containing protein D [Lingula anatina]
MATSVVELQQLSNQETIHMRLQAPGRATSPPKPFKKGKIKLDPLRALEPARKKLTTVEAQRVMAVLEDTRKRIELVSYLPFIIDDLDRFSVMFGSDLLELFRTHKATQESYNELRASLGDLLDRKERADSPAGSQRRGSAASVRSNASVTSVDDKIDSSTRHLQLVEKQLRHSVKNILRSLATNPGAARAIQELKVERPQHVSTMMQALSELRDIIMEKLLTTPVEEQEKKQYLTQVTHQERQNAVLIEQLEGELNVALEDKDAEVKKKNDVIRRLQADLHQIEKFSDEHIKRTKSEAEKQESADQKNSEGKQAKLQQEVSTLRTQLQNLISEHKESEQNLRGKKFKLETEVENWIQRYDTDMGDRQSQFEEMDTRYTEEKKQLHELEERFTTLETEYKQIQEERRIAREKREAAEREMQMMIKGATTIQAFWRSYKVRKALKSKKKGKGKGKKGKK